MQRGHTEGPIPRKAGTLLPGEATPRFLTLEKKHSPGPQSPHLMAQEPQP